MKIIQLHIIIQWDFFASTMAITFTQEITKDLAKPFNIIGKHSLLNIFSITQKYTYSLKSIKTGIPNIA